MPIALGTVGHFGVAVRDPRKAAKWWTGLFDLKVLFEFPGGVIVTNDFITIVLHKGKPSPQTLDHVSFHLPDMKALRGALAQLKRRKVSLEDPGDEIGPEGEGSKNMGLWFHDPDGYRWELSVLATQKRPRKRRGRKSKKGR
jgi:catechol 2,3-dioxygenase-like lactoylglutathione lyase family enzyme